MKTLIRLLLCLAIIACDDSRMNDNQQIKTELIKPTDKIQVLNFATFHMRFSPDANTVDFDEHSEKNKREVHAIANMLSKFKPTVILVETIPEENEKLQKKYAEYKVNKDMKFENPGEVELLAYEIGRISGVDKIYGINHKMEYNYPLINSIADSIQEETYMKFSADFRKSFIEGFDKLSTLDKLKMVNNSEGLNFLFNDNADIMTHISIPENKFVGADVAAKFYKRNLRMYSIMNSIPLSKNDRVFILMGGTHTAFFRDFISRSPKYEMVNTFEYLK